MAEKSMKIAGKRMVPGSAWRLTPTKGAEREFKGTLLATCNVNGNRCALFSVPSRKSKSTRG